MPLAKIFVTKIFQKMFTNPLNYRQKKMPIISLDRFMAFCNCEKYRLPKTRYQIYITARLYLKSSDLNLHPNLKGYLRYVPCKYKTLVKIIQRVKKGKNLL
jgi:hypothetical protein